ncbi:MAG: hypothetical protein AB2812_06635 [Candidatus Sedimenticola endophacoides]
MVNKSKIDDILLRLRRVQQELEDEFERLLVEKRDEFHYTIRRGKVVFERGVRRLQRGQRVGLWRYLRDAPLAYILSAPVIYGMIITLGDVGFVSHGLSAYLLPDLRYPVGSPV